MHIPKDEWVPRFARRLRELQPRATGDAAMAIALGEATFIEASDMDPEEAADVYALEQPPGEVAAPG